MEEPDSSSSSSMTRWEKLRCLDIFGAYIVFILSMFKVKVYLAKLSFISLTGKSSHVAKRLFASFLVNFEALAVLGGAT